MKVKYKYSPISKQTTNKLKSRQYEFDEQKNIKQHIKTRPAEAVSFSGSAISEGQKLTGKIGEAFVQNRPLNKLIDFVYDNEAAYNAIYAMLIAGILKPLLVLKTKDTDEKDKQMIATKNFLQAFLGSFLSFTIGGNIVKKAVDIIKNNLKLLEIDENNKITVLKADSDKAKELAKEILKKQYKPSKERKGLLRKALEDNQGYKKITEYIKALFKKIEYEPSENLIKNKAKELVDTCKNHVEIFNKNPNFVKNLIDKTKNGKSGTTLYEAFESLWKNSTGWITAIMKAKISSLLLPATVAFIFAKKNREKQQALEKENLSKNYSTLITSQQFQKDKEYFSAILNKNSNNTTNVAFTGNVTDNIAKGLSKGIEKLSMTNFGENSVKLLSKAKKPSARMADIESILLTSYWVQNTLRSKKIDPDQKLGLNIQTVLVTAVSSSAAFIIDWLLDGLINKGKTKYSLEIQNNIKQLVNNNQGKEIPDLSNAIKESCRKLNNPEGIAKEFVKKGINNITDEEIKTLADKLASGYGKKLSKFKSLTIFTLVVRFLVPVLMVKPAGKIKQKIKKMQQEKEQQKINISKNEKAEELKEKAEELKEKAEELKEKQEELKEKQEKEDDD